MRKLLLYILSSPLFVIGLLLDLIKLPIIIVIFLPFLTYARIIGLLRGDAIIIFPLEFCLECAVICIRVWWNVVNSKPITSFR